LSISSIIRTGLFEPASRSARTMVPGIAPMYVRRWPRISDSSRTPPTDMRSKLRSIAEAIERPREVFPTPGGPTKSTIELRASGFSFRTARNSRMRSFTLLMS
jgi:hypothetical protein